MSAPMSTNSSASNTWKTQHGHERRWRIRCSMPSTRVSGNGFAQSMLCLRTFEHLRRCDSCARSFFASCRETESQRLPRSLPSDLEMTRAARTALQFLTPGSHSPLFCSHAARRQAGREFLRGAGVADARWRANGARWTMPLSVCAVEALCAQSFSLAAASEKSYTRHFSKIPSSCITQPSRRDLSRAQTSHGGYAFQLCACARHQYTAGKTSCFAPESSSQSMSAVPMAGYEEVACKPATCQC